MTAPLMLQVTDLKQYEYCPRIVFYRYVMPVDRASTYKMAHGQAAEARIDRLEQRRTLKRYRLPDGRRHFHVWLTSERLGLSGKLDLLIESSAGWYPVDFKETAGPGRTNHRMQLCGYAMLVEEAYGCRVSEGFLYLIPGDRIERVAITDALRAQTQETMDAIRRMIVTQRLPEATNVRARCTDCEYRNYCGDVW